MTGYSHIKDQFVHRPTIIKVYLLQHNLNIVIQSAGQNAQINNLDSRFQLTHHYQYLHNHGLRQHIPCPNTGSFGITQPMDEISEAMAKHLQLKDKQKTKKQNHIS